MILLTVEDVELIHAEIVLRTGGSRGIRDRGILESALAQPRMTFGGIDLYSTLIEKASALGFSLIKNHPFVDGNKRIGHAVMEAFLLLNVWEILASVDDQESIILRLAAGEIGRDGFTAWLQDHTAERQPRS